MKPAVKTSTKVLLVAGCVIPLASVAFLICGLYVIFTADADTRKPQVLITNPERFVQDARQLIEHFRANPSPGRSHQVIPRDRLPPSLQVGGVMAADIFRDHASLIVDSNPDTQSGLRVWSADATLQHHDEPGPGPNIFWYRFCDDHPVSDRNLP